MAPRTRKRTPDPEDCVRPTPRHAKASPTRFRSARAPRINAARYRQSTLTQIVPEVSFLSRGSAAEESEDEEQAPRPVKRRRRRIGPSQKTLTQIGWINHIVVPSDDEEQEEEGGDGENEGEEGFGSEVLPSDDDEYDEVVGGEQNEIDDAEDVFYGFSDDGESLQQDKLDGGSIYGANDSPQTPRRPRPREIPSSQTPPVTPLTPLSVLRMRARYNQRSPLKALSTNGDQGLCICKEQERAKMPPPKLPTPVKGRRVRVALDSNVVKLAPTLLSERSHISDSQDLCDEDGFEAASPRGVAIGQETQAMIHQIDAACGPNPSLQNTPLRNGATSEVGSTSPSPSQANRSFNFDEEDGADAAPSAAPAKRSPILGEEFQEKEVRKEECHQEPDIEKKAGDDEEAEEEDDDHDEENHEFPTSSLPTPRAPPPTQATPIYTPTQASHASQPFALQHPSQVSTVAEITQATPPRRRPTPTQREKTCSQRMRRTRRAVGDAECNENTTLRGKRLCSQASTTDDPTQSQTPKAQCRSQQLDRIPESPLGNPNASSHSKSSHALGQRTHSSKPPRRSSPSPSPSPTTLPLHAPSSSIPQPPPPLLTSSPTSPSRSTGYRRANGSDGRQRLELSSDSGGGGGGRINGSGVSGRSVLAFDGKVLSATQMLPESLMNYSLPLPPAGWDAASSWMGEEQEGEQEGEGEEG
ncbi:hypothetical protein IWX49DRAFT_631563 [Phyllosticta citricarpa]|uniref:Uncharacterized protein n=1 Tax=Phyllosticta citricarpa TaxID=55181 RepID=A0ABR1MJS1_9PEZI